MTVIEWVLSPIIYCMCLLLELGYGLTGSHGLSILWLSIVVYILITPLRLYAQRLQNREMAVQRAMEVPLREARARYKGEEQFNEIERIYNEHNYHPIKAIRGVGGIVIQIPFLLSALFLLIDYPPMQGEPFLFIRDLQAPDALIPLLGMAPLGTTHLNLLPILMLGISVVESIVSSRMTRASRVQANIVAVVIFLLVYGLPSALVLYWTLNTVWSLIVALVSAKREGTAGD